MQIITFMTDFGTRDSYVAEVKGVLFSQVPNLNIVDITHEIPAHNVEAGAFQLLRSYSYFPHTTFHLCVVDPGVGTQRKCLFAKTPLGSFVGPDNGLLKWAIEDAQSKCGKKAQLFEIPIRQAVRPTFYGRDVFAPFLALHLKGEKTRLMRVSEILGRSFPEAEIMGRKWQGEIVCEDHFGNLVTSIPIDKTGKVEGRVGMKRIKIAPNYSAIPKGECALIRGSHGFWEIAANQASAAKILKLGVGKHLLLG